MYISAKWGWNKNLRNDVCLCSTSVSVPNEVKSKTTKTMSVYAAQRGEHVIINKSNMNPTACWKQDTWPLMMKAENWWKLLQNTPPPSPWHASILEQLFHTVFTHVNDRIPHEGYSNYIIHKMTHHNYAVVQNNTNWLAKDTVSQTLFDHQNVNCIANQHN